MGINKELNIMKNIILSKATEAAIRKEAAENKRSFSAQVAYVLEQYIKDSK
jgi:hypothetical protein